MTHTSSAVPTSPSSIPTTIPTRVSLRRSTATTLSVVTIRTTRNSRRSTHFSITIIQKRVTGRHHDYEYSVQRQNEINVVLQEQKFRIQREDDTSAIHNCSDPRQDEKEYRFVVITWFVYHIEESFEQFIDAHVTDPCGKYKQDAPDDVPGDDSDGMYCIQYEYEDQSEKEVYENADIADVCFEQGFALMSGHAVDAYEQIESDAVQDHVH